VLQGIGWAVIKVQFLHRAKSLLLLRKPMRRQQMLYLLAHNKRQSGSSDSGVAGYLYGSTSRTIIQKILFSTDATSNLVAVLSAQNRTSTGFSNYSVAGYCAGGYNDSTFAKLNTFERLAFPAETSSTLGVYLNRSYF
jgi:hypothetical protein